MFVESDFLERRFLEGSLAPVNAPSSLSWKRISDDVMEVTQRWRDGEGQEQGYTLRLERIAPR